MIIRIYRCNLCKDDVDYPYGGYRLKHSGDGAISLRFLDDETANDSIICKHCARGLKYGFAHIPENPDGIED